MSQAPSAWRVWLWAARPRTLPLGASAIVLGYCLAVRQGGGDRAVFVLALATAVLLQILSNLANDYGDALKGADGAERLGPRRMVASGLASPARMRAMMAGTASASVACGSALVLVAAWGDWPRMAVFFLLGACCVAAAVLYTVGRKPYGYHGLGDLMAGVFFGPAAVWGAGILCGAPSLTGLVLPGLAAGLCSTMVLNVNNIRDIDADRASGKRTVAVRLGRKRAVAYHLTLAVGVLACWLAWLADSGLPWPLLLLAVPLMGSAGLLAADPANPANGNAQLKNSVLFSALLSAGMGLSAALL